MFPTPSASSGFGSGMRMAFTRSRSPKRTTTCSRAISSHRDPARASTSSFTPRDPERSAAPSPLHIKLLAEVVADLDDQRDAFGIAGFCDRRRVSRGAEFPGISGAKNENVDAAGAVGVDFEFRPCHRDEFGFGPGRLAHQRLPPADGRSPQVAALAGICREDDLSG